MRHLNKYQYYQQPWYMRRDRSKEYGTKCQLLIVFYTARNRKKACWWAKGKDEKGFVLRYGKFGFKLAITIST